MLIKLLLTRIELLAESAARLPEFLDESFEPLFKLLAEWTPVIFGVAFILLLLTSAPKKDMLTPQYYPWVGTGWMIYRNRRRFHKWVAECSERLGHRTWAMYVPFSSTRRLIITDPAVVEHILETKEGLAKFLHRNSLSPDYLEELLGDGIATVDGHPWRQQRTLCQALFSMNSLKGPSMDALKTHTDAAIAALDNTDTCNLQDVLLQLTYAITTELTLGCGTGELSNDFCKSLNEAQRLSIGRYTTRNGWALKLLNSIYRLTGKRWDRNERLLSNHIKIINRDVYAVIKARRTSGESVKDRHDLLSRCIQAHPDATDKFLRDLVVNFIIAGRDATGISVMWFIYYYCKYPEEADEVRKELEAALHGARTGVTSDRDTFPATTAFLTESWRLKAPTPLSSRYAVCDVTLPDGTQVRNGDNCAWSIAGMCLSSKAWKDPLTFNPKRHYGTNRKLPIFGSGPRACVGRPLAEMETLYIISALCQRYKFKLLNPHEEPEIELGITQKKVDGLMVSIERI